MFLEILDGPALVFWLEEDEIRIALSTAIFKINNFTVVGDDGVDLGLYKANCEH